MQNTIFAQTSCIGGGSITVELVCMEMLVGGEAFDEEITILTTVTDNTGATIGGQDCVQIDGDFGSGGTSSSLGPGFNTLTYNVPYTAGGNYGDNNDFPNTIDICYDVWEDDCGNRCDFDTGVFFCGDDEDFCTQCTTVDIASIFGAGGPCPIPLNSDGSVDACTVNGPNIIRTTCNGDWTLTYQVSVDLAPPVELTCPGFLSPSDPPFTLNAYEAGTTDLLSGGTWSVLSGGGTIVDNGDGTASYDPAGTTPGTSVQLAYTGDNCCRTIETTCFVSIVECPSLDVVTMDGDGCIGDNVTLTATVTPATAVENQNFVIVWQEDGVDIPGSSSAGPDGVPGTADDISTLTYVHTLPGAGVDGCTSVPHTYTAQLFCITNFTIEQGDPNPGNASTGAADTVIPYNAQGFTCVDLDLSSLPACVLAGSFDYSTVVTSGPPFGNSWICEAILEVQTPVGNQGPFCDPFYGGACPTLGSGNTCFGGPTGAGTNTFSGNSSFGGLASTTLAQGTWSACFADSFNDTGGTEGVVNYILLDIQALLPPGCSVNGAGSSMDATNTGSPAASPTQVTVCTAPVLNTDFSEPAAGCDNFAVTDICGDLSIGYAASAAGPFDHTLADGSSLVTPADGEMIFYEVYLDANGDGMSDCDACATTTGSFTLTGCCPTATLDTAPADVCHAGTTDVCYTFSGDAEGVMMTVNGVSATCTGCGTGPLCVTLTADNTTCDVETVSALVTMLCPGGATNVTAGGVALDGSAAATAGDFDEYPDPTNFVITVTPSAGCGEAPVITDSTCPTLTSEGWQSGNAPMDGCTVFGVPPTTETYEWVQTPPTFAAAAPAACAYPDDSGTEAVTGCEACNTCPTVTMASGMQDVCSGGDADLSDAITGFAIATDPDGTAGNLVWTNDGAMPMVDGSNVTTATGLTNMGCMPNDITLTAWLECDGNGDGFGQGAAAADDSYIASGSITVSIYPDANVFVVTEVEGSCGTAASVTIVAADGSMCFDMIGNVPADPGCDAPDDVQDLTYNFDPAFPAACNVVYANTIPASCVGGVSPVPTITCPTNLDPCSNPTADLSPSPTGGVYSGDAAVFVSNDIINVSGQAPGNYTLIYTVTDPVSGCTGSVECAIQILPIPSCANAGSLNGN